MHTIGSGNIQEEKKRPHIYVFPFFFLFLISSMASFGGRESSLIYKLFPSFAAWAEEEEARFSGGVEGFKESISFIITSK